MTSKISDYHIRFAFFLFVGREMEWCFSHLFQISDWSSKNNNLRVRIMDVLSVMQGIFDWQVLLLQGNRSFGQAFNRVLQPRIQKQTLPFIT